MRVVRISEKEQSPALRKVYELAEMLDQFCIIPCTRVVEASPLTPSRIVFLDRYHLAPNIHMLLAEILAAQPRIKVLIIVDDNPSRRIWLPEGLEVHHHVIFCHEPTICEIETNTLYTASAAAALGVIEFNSDIAA